MAESVANNSSNYGTSRTGGNRVSVSARSSSFTRCGRAKWEDSIIPFIPYLRRQLALALAHYSDSLVLNRIPLPRQLATSTAMMRRRPPRSTSSRLTVSGTLARWTTAATARTLGAAITLADIAAARGRMVDYTYLHDWGHPTSADDLIYVADPDTADAIAALDPVLNARIYNGGQNLP